MRATQNARERARAQLTREIKEEARRQGAAEAAVAGAERASVRDRWRACCRAVRDWARARPHEYALIYGSPVPGYEAPPQTVAPAGRVPMVLGGLLAEALEDPERPQAPRPPPRARPAHR